MATSLARSDDRQTLLRIEIRAARLVLKALDTAKSLGVFLRLKYASDDPKLWEEIAKADIRKEDYESTSSFADDYQAVSLLKKSPNLPLKIDRKGAALAKLFEAEEICRETNLRLHRAAQDGTHPDWFPRFRTEFRSLCGPLNESVLNRVWSLAKFGKGSTVKHRNGTRKGITKSGVLRGTVTLTRDLLLFIPKLFRVDNLRFEVVDGEEYFSVPKDAQTERGCAKQPGLNVFLQGGIGLAMAQRLRDFGFDIRDQSWNQLLAMKAYLLRLATIDLSMASDLICYELVRQIAHPRWFHLWNLARCHKLTIPLPGGGPGVTISLERFCSMGNGFTFPLETAIFAAVVRTFVPRDRIEVAVYGDDIIVPQEYYDDVVSALEYLGFKVNTSKSFRGGNFFESCGSDYFRGQNVRPFFLRKEEDSGAPYSLQIANALRRYAHRRGALGCCDRRYESAWNHIVESIPKKWRNPVPEHYGDLGVIQSLSESGVKQGHLGWRIKYVDVPTINSKMEDHATYMMSLAAMTESSDLDMAGEDLLPPPYQLPIFLRELVKIRFKDPIRGLYGRPVIKNGHVPTWPTGWEWI